MGFGRDVTLDSRLSNLRRCRSLLSFRRSTKLQKSVSPTRVTGERKLPKSMQRMSLVYGCITPYGGAVATAEYHHLPLDVDSAHAADHKTASQSRLTMIPLAIDKLPARSERRVVRSWQWVVVTYWRLRTTCHGFLVAWRCVEVA